MAKKQSGAIRSSLRSIGRTADVVEVCMDIAYVHVQAELVRAKLECAIDVRSVVADAIEAGLTPDECAALME